MVRSILKAAAFVDSDASIATKVNTMSDHVVPHFHNDAGVSVIEIGSQEFMCVGANPPFDHPHVFLDLGNDNEIICPYCSTLYRFAPDLGAGEKAVSRRRAGKSRKARRDRRWPATLAQCQSHPGRAWPGTAARRTRGD